MRTIFGAIPVISTGTPLVLAVLCAELVATPLSAQGAVRPQARPDTTADAAPRSAPQTLPGAAPLAMADTRPQARPGTQATPRREATPEALIDAQPFDTWLRGFRARAGAAGISEPVLAAALDGLRPDPEVIDLDRNQSEFSRTLWDYLDRAVSEARIRNGRAAMARHGAVLNKISARYGVEAQIIAAIWGLESAYGAVRGSRPVFQSLATLAHEGRRRGFFEAELMAALRIVEAGNTTPDRMTGSWAGAMGHTQFMPTSYERFAVDWTGNGRREIWGDDPTDALASTAAYLARNGWTSGQPWGVEVVLPKGFDVTQVNRRITRLPSQWARLGVAPAGGGTVPDHGKAALLLPAGHQGAAFMIFDNFQVLETYNTADSYVIAVGHLGDRLLGGGPIRSEWPYNDRALSGAERRELQRLLMRAGFDPGGVDGRIGPLTVDAIRRYQASQGLVPDGYGAPALLERLR